MSCNDRILGDRDSDAGKHQASDEVVSVLANSLG